MKNIHIVSTDKACRLHFDSKLFLSPNYQDSKTINSIVEGRNIYITSDEEIKEGVDQWYLDKFLNKLYNSGGAQYSSKQDVIIMTTDQDLIKDGVQAIDDEFLEWFVQNTSCEEVEVIELKYKSVKTNYTHSLRWGIIIPQEEPKQTVQEYEQQGLEKYSYELVEPKQERMYSEEDMLLFAKFVYEDDGSCTDNDGNVKKDTLEQYLQWKTIKVE